MYQYGPETAAAREARREYLPTAIKILENRPHVKINAVLRALAEAHANHLEAWIRGRNLDHRRQLHDEVKLFRRALHRARSRLLPRLGPDPGPNEGHDPARRG